MKFRSWNEDYQMFYYFRDGLYYTFNPVEKEYSEQTPLMNGDSFNWQNAEQEFSINGIEMFVGDIVEFEDNSLLDECDCESRCDFKNQAVIKCYALPNFVLDDFKTGDEETYIYNNDDNLSLEEIIDKVIGNIHENKENN